MLRIFTGLPHFATLVRNDDLRSLLQKNPIVVHEFILN